MANIAQLLTEHMAIWTSAETAKRSGRGRASGTAGSVYGVKKLRELILDLAVRGKLVPQDARDEPASVLLKRIQAEKAKLIAEGKLKKDKPLAAIGEDEKPFETSIGWSWVRLNELLIKIGAGSTPLGGKQVYVQEGIPFLRSQNIWDSGLRLDDVAFILPETHSKMSGTHVYAGDLLFNITGASIGRCAIVPNDFVAGNVSQHVTIIRLTSTPILRFMHLVLISQHVQQTVMDVQVGVSREGLSIGKLGLFVIPLPPLAEQRRIVAKVDELMALCDQLEQQHSNAQDAHEALVSRLLATLTQSQNAAEFSANWQRIYAHFDVLFTTETSIDALKQTLLQLAVMGKLVPQDPNDEPASELLKRIQAEKAKLIAAGKLKKEKPLAAIGEDEKPFELPKSWEWSRLDKLSLSSEAGWSPQCLELPRSDGKWGVLKVSAVTWDKFNPNENKELPSNLVPRSEYEIKAGDFLISRANTAELVARAVIVPENSPTMLMMSDKIIRFSFSKKMDLELVKLINSSRLARDYYARVAGGTSASMKNVSRAQIQNLVIPIPPLAEQHRIVAKVDALMALCDQLKTNIQQANQQQQAIANALVAQAV